MSGNLSSTWVSGQLGDGPSNGGLTYKPTMSRTFSTNKGSRESLKVSCRCGCSAKARQMRLTAVWLRPAALAAVRRPARPAHQFRAFRRAQGDGGGTSPPGMVASSVGKHPPNSRRAQTVSELLTQTTRTWIHKFWHQKVAATSLMAAQKLAGCWSCRVVIPRNCLILLKNLSTRFRCR